MYEPKLTPRQYMERNHLAVDKLRAAVHKLEVKSVTARGIERLKIARAAKAAMNVIGDIYHHEKLSIMLLDDPGKYMQIFTVLGQELVIISKRYKTLAKIK